MATIVQNHMKHEILGSGNSGSISLEHHIIDSKAFKNRQEVMQVLVVHLDLFTCGTCGQQSTDILQHLLHKSQHPLSSVYNCELCKAVIPSRDALIHHYVTNHGLEKLHTATAAAHEQSKQAIIFLSENDVVTNNQILFKPEAQKPQVTESNGTNNFVLLDQQEANVLHDHGMFCVRDKNTKEAGKEASSTTAVKSSSRTKSKQLLKTAMRTLTKSSSDSTSTISGNHTASSNSTLPTVTGSRSKPRKPPILQRRISLTPEPKKTVAATQPPPSAPLPPPQPIRSPAKPPKPQRVHRKSEETDISKIVFVSENQTIATGSPMKLEKALQCLHCDFSSQNQEELSEHMRASHSQQELPASLQIASLEDGPLKKPDKAKARKVKPPRKIERQDLPGVYPCTQCGKTFQRLRYLRKHAHVHKTEKKFVCEECGKVFKCKGYLKVHKQKLHEGKNVFQCNQCDFTSWINAAIHAHRQIHSQGSVLCDICGYAYTDKATLAKHKRVHDPRRPFACNFPGCTWRFKTYMMCNAHIKAHTTEGKFGCQYCGYLFRHKHHLQRHEANMHGVKHEKARHQKPATVTSEQENVIVSGTDFNIVDLDHNVDLTQPMIIIKPDGTTTYDTSQYTTLLNDVIHGEEIITNGNEVHGTSEIYHEVHGTPETYR